MNRSCMKFMYLMKTFLYKCSVFTARVQPYILAGRPEDWYEAKFCANFIAGRTGGGLRHGSGTQKIEDHGSRTQKIRFPESRK